LEEFSLLLEVRFEGNIIRGIPVETSVILLFTLVDVRIIDDLFLGLYCGSLILDFCGLLILASPCFLAAE
jgi:hypothetical protein